MNLSLQFWLYTLGSGLLVLGVQFGLGFSYFGCAAEGKGKEERKRGDDGDSS